MPGSIDELSHVNHSAKLDRFADLASKETEALKLYAEDSWRSLNETLFFGGNFHVALFTLVHAVGVFAVATNAFLFEMLL